MITLQNISLQRGTRILLENASLTIQPQQKVGLIGANGSGKSSLFAVLKQELTADKGELFLPPNARIGFLAQETPALAQAAIEYVIDGDKELRAIEQQLATAQANNNGIAIANLYSKIEAIDGYTVKTRAAQILAGLGFSQEEIQQPVKSFSGGWRMRLNLAQTLMCRADLLLLDEPTNHLDLDAVIWLEEWLKSYTGTLILISHDRDFLDNVVDHIAHLERQQLKLYTGNYSAFEQQRAATLALQQASYEKQQKLRAHMQSFVERFRAKASKAKQAQSRLKALAKMELIQAAHIDSPFSFEFREPLKAGNPLLRLENADVGYGDKTILKRINFSIIPGLRLGLLGPNGAGKSTFIKCLAGTHEPIKGLREINKNLKIGYFAQHQVDHLLLEETPLRHLQLIDPKITEQEARNFLGGFAFNGDTVFSKVGIFSGGEKSRLALALLVWQRPNLLLLDEPTNHLDLDMREALTIALQSYEGALVVVSHDRHLIRTTTDSLMLVADGKISEFNEDLDSYQQWLIDFRRKATSTATVKEPKSNSYEINKLRKSLEQRCQKLEKTLVELQAENANLETILADNNLYTAANTEKLTKLLAQQKELQKKLQSTEKTWLEIMEELEQYAK